MPNLQPLLDRATSSGDVPGVVGILLSRDGPAWSGFSGLRDTATGMPMTPDTVFWIASMTKPLTSIAAMQLVEQGRLPLDAPIGDVLPALAAPLVLDGTADNPRRRPARTPVTLRHLLTHTSGYAYPRWDARLMAALRTLGIDPVVRSFDDLARIPLVFDPGEQWMYGIGIDVVGKMIEAVTAQPLDRVIEDRVCRPLGMADMVFVLTDEQRARLAPVHVRDAGRWVPSPNPLNGRRLPFMAGGGGMFGTARDYARLLAELLAGAPNLLTRSGWAAMTANQIGDLDVQILRSADLGQSVDLDLAAGQRAKWSLGFMVNPVAMPGRRNAGSQFWSGLANTYFWLDGAAGRAGVLMTAVLPFGYPGAFKLFEAFERSAYAR